MRLFPSPMGFLDRERGFLFPWSAVLFAAGIGCYFAWPGEPGRFVWATGACLTGLACVAAIAAGPVLRPVVLLILVPVLGFLIAGWRAHDVAAVKLGYRYYGPIEGRVVAMDRSQSDAPRLTLDRVVLYDTRVERTPARVRVSIHGPRLVPLPRPGATVVLTGHLSPPSGPVEPGGYDFQRQAWFQRLGAVGYTRTPVLELEPPEGGAALVVFRARMRISEAVRAALPGEAGAFAAAITTGDRSALDRETLENLRATNLAHLLAISGLHMGLLTGFVFAALRYGLALAPRIALAHPIKKHAAVAALLAGAGYLALSGNNVATERAFIMVAVMLAAVLFDRRAVTLRAVAVAALIVLTLRPETLIGPGFQMSFAATTALVSVYGWMRDRDWSQSGWPWALRLVGGVALSSFVAGIATAPIAAAHFNQVPHYGLLANILSVPLMGLVVIPGAVLAALLSPVGLEWIGLKVMEPAILWILAVARWIGGWDGALSYVVTPQWFVLPFFALGGAFVAIPKDRLRVVGVPIMAVAFASWTLAARPDALISETGGLVGVLTEEGRALSKARGDGFSASSWLENDGDPVEQAVAAGRLPKAPRGSVRALEVSGVKVLHATGKSASEAARRACREADLIVVNVPLAETRDCLVFDAKRLAETGALALYADEDGLRVVPARDPARARLWSQ